MQTRKLENNPIARKILKASPLAAVVFIIGGLTYAFGQSGVKPLGLAIIIAGIVGHGLYLIRALKKINCPGCNQILTRGLNERSFSCQVCGIQWELPAK